MAGEDSIMMALQNGGLSAPQPQAANEQMNKFVQQLMQRTLMPRLGGPPGGNMPQPGQGGGQQGPQPLGDMSIRPGRYGKGGTAAFQQEMGQKASNSIMMGVQRAVQQHKQKQLNEATAMWQTLQAAHERLSLAGKIGKDGTVDLMQDPIAAAILQDPKKMKNMAKAFQVDFLNPEKTNVYAEGLKKAMQMDHAGKMVKMLRSMKMMQQPKPQLNPQQQQQMGSELGRSVSGMASPGAIDAAQMDNMLKTMDQMERTQLLARDRYQISPGTDPDTGNLGIFAVDKTNPDAGAKRVEVDGHPIGGKPNAKLGSPVTAGGTPIGVWGPTGAKFPGDKDWTPEDNQHFLLANAGWSRANAEKEKLAGIRAETYVNSRWFGVIDKTTGQEGVANAAMMIKNPDRYAMASPATQAMQKEAAFTDMNWNADNVEYAAQNLKQGFTNRQRAAFMLAMRSTDPAASFSTFLSTQVGKSLKEDQVQYLTAIKSLQENSLAIRNIAGFGGAGSDQLREAILRTVPSEGTPNMMWINSQLQLFRGTLERLHLGTPGVMQPYGGGPPNVNPPKPKIDLNKKIRVIPDN